MSKAHLEHLWPICDPKVVPRAIFGRFGEAFWDHFGLFFWIKIRSNYGSGLWLIFDHILMEERFKKKLQRQTLQRHSKISARFPPDRRPRSLEAILEPTFFRASISVAAPGPREDKLHAKILQEI